MSLVPVQYLGASSLRRSFLPLCGLTLMTVVLGVSPRAAFCEPVTPPAAGGYLELPIKAEYKSPQSKVLLEDSGLVRRILTDQAPFDADNRKKLKDYYTSYVFARMTRAEYLHDLGGARNRLEQNLSENYSKSAQARRELVTMTIEEMKKFMAGNYHPAVRANACLILGNINSSEARNSPPVPMAEMLPELLNAFNDPAQIDAVRAAAVVGIERHVDLRRRFPAIGPLPENQAAQISKAMVGLVQQKEPPAGRTAAGHGWMQESAARILGRLGNVGEGGSAVTALLGLIDNEGAGLDARTTAVRALGQIQLTGPATVNANQVTQQVLTLAMQCCDHELQHIVASEPVANPVIQPKNALLNSDSGRNADEPLADPATEPARRRLASRMYRLRLGLAGEQNPSTLSQYAESNNQLEVIKRGADAIDGVMQVVTDRKTMLADFRSALVARREALQVAAGPKGSGTPVADDAPAAAVAPNTPTPPAATETSPAPF